MVGIHCTHKQTSKHIGRLLLGRELLKEVIPLKQAPIGPCGIHNLNYFLNLVSLSVTFLEIWYENTKIYTLKNLSLQALVSIWFTVQHLLWWEHPPLLQHHCSISITIFESSLSLPLENSSLQLHFRVSHVCHLHSIRSCCALSTASPPAFHLQSFSFILPSNRKRNLAFHHVSSFCIANHGLAA